MRRLGCMSSQPDFGKYWVPVVSGLWGLGMTLAAIIGRVQDLSFAFPMRLFLLLALPGYLIAGGWLLAKWMK
jgi:hypothetical protein